MNYCPSCCPICCCLRKLSSDRFHGKQGPPGPPGPPGPKGDQGPPGITSTAHGFAYNPSESNESGTVVFSIAGPLQDVELTGNGLKILKSGVYQISYNVAVESSSTVNNPAKFQIVINNMIKVVSSFTESSTSNHLSSTELFSLLEGDVVILRAEIPQEMSYKLPSLQVIQVA